MTFHRSIFSSAREGLLPEVLCGVHKKWGTPVVAILLHVRTSCNRDTYV